MKKIYIFGLGKGKLFVDRCLRKENTGILGLVDNYMSESLGEIQGIPVIKQKEIRSGFDYIIVTLMQYEKIRKEMIEQEIEAEKIICFFDVSDAESEEYWSILDPYKWRFELMWKNYRDVTVPTLANLPYEIYADSKDIQEQCPRIVGVDETIETILEGHKSLARFGDGEFELMYGRRRAPFQDTQARLGACLREALDSTEDNLLIAIADNYGSLDKYTDEAAEAIRTYMSRRVRKEHMNLLKPERWYYDAYLSRPYMIYRNKKKAGKRFDNIKKIWNGRNVLIVEGEYTRFGVGNNLLDHAACVSRILAPSKNAFSRYDEIIEEVRRQGKGKLILAVLGPTATVMAYDLAKEGFWILDIGQLDVEYEWYLRGVDERCDIPYKCVSEVAQYGEIVTDAKEDYVQKYQKEILAKIL